MPKFKTIRDLDLAGKRVFIRVDFNVPQDKKTGAITNNARTNPCSFLQCQHKPAAVIIVYPIVINKHLPGCH